MTDQRDYTLHIVAGAVLAITLLKASPEVQQTLALIVLNILVCGAIFFCGWFAKSISQKAERERES